MELKFKAGDRIRLTTDVSSSLPFLIKGATGKIQQALEPRDETPWYFIDMDPVGDFKGEDLDYWFASEEDMEAENV